MAQPFARDRAVGDGAVAINRSTARAHPLVTDHSLSCSAPTAVVEPAGVRGGGPHIGHAHVAAERSSRIARIRTLIVDDCTLHRDNLAAIFTANGGAVPAVAWDMPSLCAALSRQSPEIVLLSMGSRDNVILLRSVREACPDARVIAVGLSEDDESEIVACAEAGVAGYHLRAESLDDLLVLMSKVAVGESFCSSKVSAILLKRLSTLAAERQPESRELVLTAREIQILRLLELGLSNRAIADQLCIALHTVKNHVHAVLSKLGVSTRAEAGAYARSVGYTEMPARA
jgi:DNA-binding NarL/FixJ family response regulator